LKIRAVAVIPTRYDSTRLPGKPLLDRTGKPLIQHVWEKVRAASALDEVIVATDDRRIFDAVQAFGGNALMTSPKHSCGTERVAEAVSHLRADIVVNVQGDEPETEPGELDALVQTLAEDPSADMATLAFSSADPASYANPNAVKVVLDRRGFALYFSRSGLPGTRTGFPDGEFLVHRGIYAYTLGALLRFVRLPRSHLETREELEQLRALEHGLCIKVVLTENPGLGVDTPEDYERFVAKMERLRT